MSKLLKHFGFGQKKPPVPPKPDYGRLDSKKSGDGDGDGDQQEAAASSETQVTLASEYLDPVDLRQKDPTLMSEYDPAALSEEDFYSEPYITRQLTRSSSREYECPAEEFYDDVYVDGGGESAPPAGRPSTDEPDDPRPEYDEPWEWGGGCGNIPSASLQVSPQSECCTLNSQPPDSLEALDSSCSAHPESPAACSSPDSSLDAEIYSSVDDDDDMSTRQRHIYETAFDSRVKREVVDDIDRLVQSPVLHNVLHPPRRGSLGGSTSSDSPGPSTPKHRAQERQSPRRGPQQPLPHFTPTERRKVTLIRDTRRPCSPQNLHHISTVVARIEPLPRSFQTDSGVDSPFTSRRTINNRAAVKVLPGDFARSVIIDQNHGPPSLELRRRDLNQNGFSNSTDSSSGSRSSDSLPSLSDSPLRQPFHDVERRMKTDAKKTPVWNDVVTFKPKPILLPPLSSSSASQSSGPQSPQNDSRPSEDYDHPWDLLRRNAANLNAASSSSSSLSSSSANKPAVAPPSQPSVEPSSSSSSSGHLPDQSASEEESGSEAPPTLADAATHQNDGGGTTGEPAVQLFANNPPPTAPKPSGPPSRSSLSLDLSSINSPKRSRQNLTLNFGCAALSVVGESVDPNIPLEKQGWYHGSISRVDAEHLLRVLKEGSYLVRNSESSKQDFSLSLKSARGFMHMKIVHNDGKFILGQFSKPFTSIPEMIHHYSINKLPIKGAEHMSLLYPVIDQLL